MDSLNHLKTNYRPRYLNKEGQKQAFDIPGENVLKYIQGCFDTCAKEFKVCSPALSTCSPSILIHDQDQLPTQNKDKGQPERDKINHVNNGFDVFTLLPSPDKRDACLDDNASSLDVDIDMISLGSPALLIDEMSHEMMLRFEDEAHEMDFQNSRDVRESERYPSTKEVKELSIEEAKCSAMPSSKKEIPRSLASLETIACSFAQRNSANVEPEDECEFLIEESFGIPSSSWISSSKKSPKPKKIPPQEKERTRQHAVNIQNKRGSQKLVTLSPVNQTEMKSTNAAQRTVDGLQNVSRTDGTMSPVDEKSLLISSTVQGGRQHGLSKHDTSVGINNRVSEVRSLTENHASLLEEKQRNYSSISKKPMKQTHSKTKPSTEMKNKESQDAVTAVLVSEDNQGSQDSNIHSKNTISALKPICSEGSSTNLLTRTPTKSRKRRNSPRITSSEKTLQTRRNNVTESGVKISRREKGVLDFEESFQSEHGDEQCNEVDENPDLNEIQRLSHSGKKTHQKGRKAVLVTPRGNNCGRASYQEDSSKHYLTSIELKNKESQKSLTAVLVTEDNQGSQDSNLHSKNTISALKPICSEGSSAKPLTRTPTKSRKRRNSPRITSSEKTLQTWRNTVTESSVKISRREKGVLDPEESFQSEDGDEQCNEVDENPFLKEIQRLTHSGKKTHQRGRARTQSYKRQNSQRITSSKKTSQTRRYDVTGSNIKITRRGKEVLGSEENFQSEHGDEQCNEVDENPFLKEIQRLTHSGQKTHQRERTSTQSCKRQNSQTITSFKKAPQIRRNNVTGSNVKITRRKKSLLDFEESFQSEHGDKQCNEVDENPFLKEIQRLSHSGKKTHQERRKAVLVTPRGNNCGRASHQEDSPKHNLTEKRSNASIKQQNHDAHLLKYSCELDKDLYVSGPVDSTDLILQDMSSSGNDLNSESESEDRVEAMNGLVSNSLKHKLVFPTNTPHVRRTKRMRIKPLEYWRGERVNYRTRPSGGFVIGGIISPEQKEPRQPKPKRAKQSAVELGDKVSLKDPSQPALVFDAASNQEVLQECVRSGSSQLITINNEVACIYKYLNTPSFATGKIVLKPLKEKGYQYSHTDTLVFHIANGKLLLTMYDQCYSLTTGDYFFIPPGNVYNLHNLLNKECVMHFTQLKGKRPENK